MKVRKNDTVIVISGNSRGKTGKVLKLFPGKNRLIVEGVNIMKRHTKPSQRNPQGGIVQKEAPIHVSNVMVVDPKSGKPTRVGGASVIDPATGRKKHVRVARITGEMF
ncbi:MAG: 50S ribosomal protein L24 [Bacteroidota bacterium]